MGKLAIDAPARGVARLTILNPERRGALDHDILDAIPAALADSDAGCVLLTGSDGIFSAGYDIVSIGEAKFAEEAEALVARPGTLALEALEAHPRPTLAVLGGHALGGGLELALACDLRIAVEGAKLGMPPAKLGLVYSHEGLRRFIDAIGAPRTRELFLLGRNIDARTALEWGLVNWVVSEAELESRALELALELAGNAPLSLAGTKRVIAALLAAHGELDPALEAELVELRRECFSSDDVREGLTAFAEKRAPRWSGH